MTDEDPRIQTCVCGARFVFRKYVKTGNRSPITVDPRPDGNVEVLADGGYRLIPKGEAFEGPRFLNHFANCGKRDRFGGRPGR